MKIVFAIIFGLSLNCFAQNAPGEPPGEIISGDPTPGENGSTASISNSDCDKALVQIAMAQKPSVPNQLQLPGVAPKKDSQVLPVDPNPTYVAAVSNDPFGSPCRFR